MEVAYLTSHSRVRVSPLLSTTSVSPFPVNLSIVTRGDTLTVTDAYFGPSTPLAVNLYVTVEFGDTVTVPLARTSPTPLSMVT